MASVESVVFGCLNHPFDQEDRNPNRDGMQEMRIDGEAPCSALPTAPLCQEQDPGKIIHLHSLEKKAHGPSCHCINVPLEHP